MKQDGRWAAEDLENEYHNLNEEYDIINKMEDDIRDKHRKHIESKEDHSSCYECSPDVMKKNMRWVQTKKSQIITQLELLKTLLEEIGNISEKTDEEAYKIYENCVQYFYKYNSHKEEHLELTFVNSYPEMLRRKLEKGCMDKKEKEIVCRLLASYDRLEKVSYDKFEEQLERENINKILKEYFTWEILKHKSKVLIRDAEIRFRFMEDKSPLCKDKSNNEGLKNGN